MKKLTLLLFFISAFFTASAQFANVNTTPLDAGVGIAVIAGNDTVSISPIKYYKQKIGSGAWAAGFTYGIAKAKNKNFYKGKNSPNVLHVGDKFRFTFGAVPEEYKGVLYMFGPEYSIKNFSLCKFDVKKDRRELTTGEVSLWGGSDVGTKEVNDVSFDVKTVAPNVYEATVTSAKPGEYCFLFSDNGVGAYTSVFDFSVPED